MSEFVTSVRFKADGTDGLVGQLSAAEKQTKKLGTTVDQLSREFQKEATESKQAAAALGTLDAASDRVAAGSVRTRNAVDAVTKSVGQQRASMANLSFQIQDIAQGFALGTPPMTIFAQQGGQLAFAMSGLSGKIGTVASFLAGPWGSALLIATAAGGALVSSLLDTDKAADQAKEGLTEFAKRQSDIAQFIDLTTGKLKEQNEALIANARLTRIEAIAANNAEIRNLAGQARSLVGEAGQGSISALDYSAREGVPGSKQRALAAAFDKELKDILDRTRGNVQALDRELRELAEDRPEFAKLAGEVNEYASKAVLASRDSERLNKELRALAGDTTAVREEAKKAKLSVDKLSKTEREAAAAAKKAAAETLAFDKSMNDLARSLEQAERAKFASEVDRLTNAYTPLQAAAENYREELELIDKLLKRGEISAGQAGQFRKGAEQARLEALDAALKDEFGAAGKKAGEAFNREALARAEAIGQIIGGKAGDALTTVIGLISGAKTGDFTAIGGRTGGFATILADVFGGKNSPFVTGLKDIFNPLKDGLKDIGGDIASALGIKGGAGGIGQIAGRAAGGAAIGAGVSGIIGGSGLGGSLGGALGGALGGELLGSLGSFAGPVGSIVGAIGGSLIGGLLKGNKTAGAVITGPGNARIGGADTAAYGTAGDLGSAVTSGLDQIAQALGGTLTAGGITAIGTRGGEFRVNTTGDSLKGKNGARGFGDDSAAAVAFALADRISDGAITGISQKVAQALRSSSDIDSAVQEAVKVKAIEELLAGILNPFETAINEFEGQMAERLRIGRQYGFDLVALEEQNNKERLALQEQLLRTQVGSIQDFLDDLSFGDLFQGSSVEKRDQLLTEIDAARAAAEEGQAGAADRLAGLLRNLVSTSKDAFGTAGGFASDINLARTTGEGIVSEAQRQLDEAVKQTQLQDEANEQLAQIRTGIEQTNQYLKGLNLTGLSFGINPYIIEGSL
ncbi:phage tail length tape measure family protein [Pacificimonas sp. ICDLI1SI03]